MKPPSDNEIRLAIAEACGWKWTKWGNPPDESNRYLRPPDRPASGSLLPCERPSHGTPVNLYEVPDYPNDLNAIHDAVIATFTDSIQQLRFSQALHDVVAEGTVHFPGYNIWDAENATARQRCEAFLKTKGLKP